MPVYFTNPHKFTHFIHRHNFKINDLWQKIWKWYWYRAMNFSNSSAQA